jgi:hypothetical protein
MAENKKSVLVYTWLVSKFEGLGTTKRDAL